MIFQQEPTSYRSRRKPWGTLLLSFLCALLALAIVLGIRSRIRKSTVSEGSDSQPPATASTVPTTQPKIETLPTQPPSLPAQATPEKPTNPPDTPIRSGVRQSPTPARPSLADDVPSNSLLSERTRLLKMLSAANPADRTSIEAKLGDINIRLATTPVPSPSKVEHIVRAGDTLGGIASTYVCPRTLIQKINGLRDHNIRAGQKLYVLQKPSFAIEVSRSRNTLLVTLNGEFFKRYSVCTGADGKTPLGTFQITEKTDNPTWYPSGQAPIPFGQPGNILGTRWMRLEATGSTARIGGIGIHGTWDDASIGTAASDGCIRMHNADVEELYLMLPLRPHVQVKIVD